jgi:Ca2+-binding EF-hand superfamily protein
MKKLFIIAMGLCVLGLLAPSIASAKGKKHADSSANSSNAILAQFDTDKDGQLSDTEVAALQKDYAANKTEILKKFDVNNDGKLDDTEVAALKSSLAAPHGKGGKKGKKH